MARRKRGFKIFLWLVLLGALAWAGFKYYDNIAVYLRSRPKVRELVSEQSAPRQAPAGFPLKNLKEKELDLNQDGRGEILITSFADSKPFAVLVDADMPERELSQVFDFSTENFSGAQDVFKSQDAPEFSQAVDLNADGTLEIILDLKDYGAYTEAFGVLAFKNGKLEWATLKESEGSLSPAVFRDGSSVRNSNVFKIIDDGGRKVLVQIIDEEAEAYVWDGAVYAYDKILSGKILDYH